MPLEPDAALLFLHIPKTAGTALVASLDRLYSPEERIHLYDRQPDSIHPQEFFALPEADRAKLRFVAGHFAYGLHRSIPRSSRYITVLREPVDRLLSLYEHQRTVEDSKYHVRIRDEGWTFEDFVLDDKIEQTDNDMVRFLSGQRAAVGRCGPEMLEAARQHIDEHFDAVLVQEDMGPSLQMLKDALGVQIPTLERRNVSGDRMKPGDLAASVIRRIQGRVWLDAKLYEYARARVANRPR